MKRIFLETGNVIHPRSPRLGQPALDSDLGPEVSDGCPHNVAKAMGLQLIHAIRSAKSSCTCMALRPRSADNTPVRRSATVAVVVSRLSGVPPLTWQARAKACNQNRGGEEADQLPRPRTPVDSAQKSRRRTTVRRPPALHRAALHMRLRCGRRPCRPRGWGWRCPRRLSCPTGW
jgi:hypothetical protein